MRTWRAVARAVGRAADGVASEAVRRGWRAAVQVGQVRAGRPSARRFTAFGEGSVIGFPHVAIVGEDRTTIGEGTVIGPYATVSAGLPGQPPNPWWAPPTLVIGDRCWLGRGITITAHLRIEIGDDVWTGSNVFVSDQNHAWDDPDLPIGRQAAPARPVTIGDGAWLGHGAIVLPGASIGRRAVVAAGAIVTGDIPDHGLAVGAPARVVRILRPDEVA